MSILSEIEKRGYKFNEKQKEFFINYELGYNIFLTGSGGTGKSFVFNALFEYLDEKKFKYAKTALTGVAAINIKGSTLHSWLGCGLALEPVDDIVKKISVRKKFLWRIKNVRAIFIDEISMCSAEFFDKVEQILRKVKGIDRPFGGIQIILSGDALQLPPVFNKNQKKEFFFDSTAWKNGAFKAVYLKELVRQDSDKEFGQFLEKVRVGEAEDFSVIEECFSKNESDMENPVYSFSKNQMVDDFNKENLDKIDQPLKTYYSKDKGTDHHIKALDKNCLAPPELDLKVGAQVMLLYNIDVENGLCNGSVGVVKSLHYAFVIVDFPHLKGVEIERKKWSIMEQEVSLSGEIKYKEVAYREQIPLRLSWAISVHKSQSQTIPNLVIDCTNFWENGQAYVALSRAQSRKGLCIKNFSSKDIKVDERCIEFYRQIEQESENTKKAISNELF